MPFKVVVDPEENALQISIVQGFACNYQILTIVSLFDNDSVDDHLRIGHGLSSLGDENIMIVGGGIVVHNRRAATPLLGAGGTRPDLPFPQSLQSYM